MYAFLKALKLVSWDSRFKVLRKFSNFGVLSDLIVFEEVGMFSVVMI